MSRPTNQQINKSTNQQTQPVRLITVCGSIQLISAIAAIRTWENQNKHDNRSFKNIFLFYSLNQDSPKTTRMFLDTLEKMARQLTSVAGVWYWEDMEDYPVPLTPKGEPLPSTLDQLWINSTFHPEIKKLCQHYNQAKIMAYGDGPGIYFTEKCRYIFPDSSKKHGLISLAKTLTKKVLALLFLPQRHLPQIQEGFFLFPNIFEEPPADMLFTTIKTETFYNVFEELKSIFDFSFLNEVIESSTEKTTSHELPATSYQPRVTSHEPITILLTANLSEAGRMEEQGELTAYENIIKEKGFTEGIILIKPHPRDRQEKIKRLKSQLERTFHRVAVLDHPQAKYIPFELFIMHLRDKYFGSIDFRKSLRIITTSTACLTLAKIYGLECQVGLREKDIKQFFKPERIKNRLEHNARLKIAVAQSISALPQKLLASS